jgi:hypothetical protein
MFQPGQSGNPNGRKPGTRNKRTEEIFSRLEARGDKDPADFLSEVVTSESEPKELRVQAANFLMPYKYGKRGVIPVARFIPDQIEVPDFQTVAQAEAYLASIPVLFGKGEIDSQSALELSQLTKNWLDAIYARQDYELKVQAQGGGSEQHITISGGLPSLPGCNIIGLGGEEHTPRMNGHNGHGAVIEPYRYPGLSDSVCARGPRAMTHAQPCQLCIKCCLEPLCPLAKSPIKPALDIRCCAYIGHFTHSCG